MIRIGVTGGIGSGKSTVSSYLAEKGAYVFDADSVAKEILATNTQLQQELIEEFSDDITDAAGNIVNEKLARIGFSSRENQETLNALIHPYVVEAHEITQQKIADQEETELYLLDAPLLFEAGLEQHVDFSVLVCAQMNIRLKRALERGNLSRDEILRRMDLQLPEEEGKALADFVIHNNGTEADLRSRVEEIYHQIVS